eukprot:CAMPEP_0178924762 /NCGR_PEP_ID=MMETSP0786-20121207/17510_1 /TAXON_ID=186022 /ORGANISM="Thalassionema frauenfeldii, Strain CCMP 1798" /LENGTH=352 /DNA_ID=CAMNT_0020599515 /DNA_START=175 /DNA_END=1233 /DNA_ORIENTATION=+
MIGTDESLRHEVANSMFDVSENCDSKTSSGVISNSGWGIFPRVYSNAVQLLGECNRPYILSASAVEFHLGACFDLLSSSPKPVQVDPDTCDLVGATLRDMRDISDLLRFLTLVRTNRTTRSTRMNAQSSRSHAALILYLRQMDSNSYCQTAFTLVDLAGAERPTKTKEKRFTGTDMIIWQLSKGGEVPIGAQAFIVNWELTMIATEIEKATESYKKQNRCYKQPRQLSTDAIQFLSSGFNGTALTAMCLCLSSANVNGWETWFSLQWGESVSKLAIPVRSQKPVNIHKALVLAEREATMAKRELEGAAKNRFYAKRAFRVDVAYKKISDLKHMLDSVTNADESTNSDELSSF